MKIIQLFSAIALLQSVTAKSKKKDDVNAQGYPRVNILNQTPYPASGYVNYGHPLFCKPDVWYVEPSPKKWTAHTRGLCLVHKIEGSIIVPGCDKTTVRRYYSHMMTAYADFQLIPTNDKCTFAITRRRTAAANAAAYESGLRGSTSTFLQHKDEIDDSSSSDNDEDDKDYTLYDDVPDEPVNESDDMNYDAKFQRIG